MMRPVKLTRQYHSTRRQDQAEQTREAVVTAARQLFLRNGYAATTVAAVAEAAGVSVETVYKGFANKPGLVRAIWERGLAGRGPVPAEQRSDALQVSHSDPRAVIRGWGKLSTEVGPLVAPILLLVRAAAAGDPEMASLYSEVEAGRLSRMGQNARYLSEGGHLRPGVTFARARDVLWSYSSAELYELLVIRRRWSREAFGHFIAEGMIAALLPPDGAEAAPAKRQRT